jgi:putative PIN family toxin of toxin-antitoxin system
VAPFAAPMRLVLDTNVLVSALLHPGRTPDLALLALRAAGAVVLVDARVEAEYREVLGRAKFKAIDPGRREALLAAVLGSCERVAVGEPSTVALIDPDDRAFVDVALAGRADAVVTGNGRHYPGTLGFAVLSPAELLARLT